MSSQVRTSNTHLSPKFIYLSQDKNIDENITEEWQLFGCMPYLNKRRIANLKKYKYAGGDFGYMYRFFYNPCSMKLVTLLPETLA